MSGTRGLLGCILAWCVVNLIWIHLNTAPPRSWDDAEYLADSISTYHPLERGDLIEFVRTASRLARGSHPPMTKLLPIPMYVLFGPGTRAALYAYTALIPVFCVYVFLLGRALSRSNRTALLSLIVTCLFPLTYGLSRLVMAEFGLAVAAVASQYHLYMCLEARRGYIRHSVLAGAFIGWGLLWKISFPPFVVGPVCYLLIRTFIVSDDAARHRGRHALLVAAAAALTIAGPFYFLRLKSLLAFLLYASTPSASLEQFSYGPVLSVATVLNYWTAVANFGTSAYLFVLFVCLVVLQLLRRRWPLPIQETVFIGSCALLPLAVLSFQYLKEPRHLFPAFAMLGIVLAALLSDNLRNTTKKGRLCVLTAILAFPVYQVAYLSFGIPWTPSKDIRLGPLVLLAADRDSLFVRPANSTQWPVREIVDLLASGGAGTLGRAARVRVVGHIPFLDGPVLNYESLLKHRQPLVYSMLRDPSLSPTWWDFVVVMSGPAQTSAEYREPVLEKILEVQRLPYTAFARVALPQNREAVLYRAAPAASLSAGAIGEDLVTATDRGGSDLFPVTRAEWDLPDGRRSVVLTRDETPIEFRYVYVPDSTRFLTWEVVRKPDTECRGAKYRVTVFDMHSRRGPAQTIARVFDIPAVHVREEAKLGLDTARRGIVTLQFSLLNPNDNSETCIGWSRLRLVGDLDRVPVS